MIGRARSETLRFDLTLNTEVTERHKDDVTFILGKNPPKMDVEDHIHLNYTLCIEYWGEVCAKLQAMNRLLQDPHIIVDVTTKELTHGSCLIQEVFDELRTAQSVIANRNPPTIGAVNDRQ